MSGIRAKIAVSDPIDCPLAEVARDVDGTLEDVRYTRPDDDDRVVEEFGVPESESDVLEARADGRGGSDGDDSAPTEVFASDRSRRYQIERESGPCTCELIEDAGYPISGVDVRDGTLELTLNLPGSDALREVVEILSGSGRDVDVRYLMRNAESDDADPIVVDRMQLTDRQREVLETAYETGYFDYPRRANAGDVADELGIAPSTFSEHLAAAQSRLLESVLE